MATPQVIVHEGRYDGQIYRERVNRSECFLGRTPAEQAASQDKLSGATVGIAGAGGIGGAIALRLARLGVRHLKLADPQSFDWTNVNRQLGATRHTIGRNKAEVVGELVYDMAGDVTVEVYPEGITRNNAEPFVEGCDLVLDQLEFFVIAEKFALHRAFRRHRRTKCIVCCSVVGWAGHLYKFEHDSLPIEQWYGLPDDAPITPEVTDRLIRLWAPRLPRFPSYEGVQEWMARNKAAPIFTGAPPLAEGLLIQRIALVLMDLERPPYATPLPPIPHMYCYDAATLEGHMVVSDGAFKNRAENEALWASHDAAAVA
ncbi:MAG TPA: ThiF family adenylyltransferase [Methylomirabilota bacterium]|nr:ThiF family adenylyltransferase [Methylomirabilota bacterium]